ncbi:hypothetical protein PTKIN_Ptkin08bG0064200 [Pterospermum kingtungense]
MHRHEVIEIIMYFLIALGLFVLIAYVLLAVYGRHRRGIAAHDIERRTNAVVYKNEESNISDCAICLEELRDGDSCRILPKCNHLYHQLCIDKWLLKNGHCPLCRASLRRSIGTNTIR